MSRVVDEILISWLQDFEQWYKLNPIDIKINNTQVIASLSIYEKYHLKNMPLLVSSSFNQTTDVIFINSNRLNNTKKTLINIKIHNILGVINLTEGANLILDLIKRNSVWLNIIFKESNREEKHFILR